jgi:hypothetical protein
MLKEDQRNGFLCVSEVKDPWVVYDENAQETCRRNLRKLGVDGERGVYV